MQINIDKKAGVFLAVIALLLAVILGMLISDRSNDDFSSMHDLETSETTSALKLTGAEIMFLQMMIPHHQQAVDISELALTKSGDEELRALAVEIRDGQAAEIVTMKAWLTEAGEEIESNHSMGDVGGMLTAKELDHLSAATGHSFDSIWLKGMTVHHEGALHMSEMILDSKMDELNTFGDGIVVLQSEQIKQMATMLKRIEK